MGLLPKKGSAGTALTGAKRRLPDSIPAVVLKLSGVVGLLGAISAGQNGASLYSIAMLSGAISLIAFGCGLQYVFDISNILLRSRDATDV